MSKACECNKMLCLKYSKNAISVKTQYLTSNLVKIELYAWIV